MEQNVQTTQYKPNEPTLNVFEYLSLPSLILLTIGQAYLLLQVTSIEFNRSVINLKHNKYHE